MTRRLTPKLLRKLIKEELDAKSDKGKRLEQMSTEEDVRKAIAPLLKAIGKFEDDCPESLMQHVIESLEDLWNTLEDAYKSPLGYSDVQRVVPQVKSVSKRFTASDVI